MRWVALLFVVPCACAQLTGVADLSVGSEPPPAAPDGVRDDDGAADAGTPLPTADAPFDNYVADATRDVPDGACGLPTNDTFATVPPPPWLFRGNAAFASPGVRLTPDMPDLAGALYWDEAQTFDRFDVTFGYVVTTNPASTTYGPGDGLAFAWTSGAAAPPLVTGNGGGLGVSGLTGWAVAVDAYQNPEYSDPAVPNLSIKNTADMSNVAATGALPALIDGNPHTVRVRLAGGSVTVALDGSDVLGPTVLPGYVAFSGYFGFSAATGGAYEDHLLTRVSARIGTTGPCAAP